MVYITGDVHGDITRFRKGKLRWLGKKDTLIILGDFGFIWSDSPQEKEAIAWLAKRKYTILFLDGTHENFDLLYEYPVGEFAGGKARHIAGNLYHACRGSIFTIEGKKYLCFGGGESTDQEDREMGVNWWKEEMPSKQDMIACVQNLEAHDYTVDYVLTHDAPSKLLNFNIVKQSEESELHRFLDKVLLKINYRKWYFGRYHKDTVFTPKAEGVFLQVIPMKD
ncbi:MAG: metallophosphoesterase [Faecalibacterium sp.]